MGLKHLKLIYARRNLVQDAHYFYKKTALHLWKCSVPMQNVTQKLHVTWCPRGKLFDAGLSFSAFHEGNSHLRS